MSVFVQQNHTECRFTADSWVILSPVEQSIKNKIESVGTPLKDWDINIYRGVLTGCNEAFIISTEKRDEILTNCQTDDERKRTAELIRPILRGRDIKRYGYDWAGLYLIATFPSRNYDIEQYPAVKQHLLSFGMERLEQTGKDYTVDGQKVKARKKTNNKWFETQDSISYWEEIRRKFGHWLLAISGHSALHSLRSLRLQLSVFAVKCRAPAALEESKYGVNAEEIWPLAVSHWPLAVTPLITLCALCGCNLASLR